MEAHGSESGPEASRTPSALQEAGPQGGRRGAGADGRRVLVAIHFVDTHLHLEELGDSAEVIAQAHAAGVTRMIAVGVDLERSRQAVALAEQHPGVWAGAGHHPEDHTQPDLAALRDLAAHPKVVVIGEIGLDFHDQAGPAKEAQIARLHDLCTIALDLDLPVSIHNRGASEALAEAIAPYRRLRGVMHYFSLEWDWAERFLDLGFHLSFAGLVTRPSRHALREVAKRCPAERLLLETDSPFGNARTRKGVQNQPAYLIDTAELVAELRGISLQELSDLELSNALRLFARMS